MERLRSFPRFDELCKGTMSRFRKVEVIKHGLVGLNSVAMTSNSNASETGTNMLADNMCGFVNMNKKVLSSKTLTCKSIVWISILFSQLLPCLYKGYHSLHASLAASSRGYTKMQISRYHFFVTKSSN